MSRDFLTCENGNIKIPSGVFPLPDTDINGIGIILSFSITAWSTFAVALAFYSIGSVPEELRNNFDRLFLRIPTYSKADGLTKAFQRGAIFVSEPQLVIAICLLGAGFHKWEQKSAYDFHAILYISWMACNMHLSSLTVLRRFMQEHKGIRALRILGMFILFIMMCVAIRPTIQWGWTVQLLRGNRCSTANNCKDLTMTVSEHLAKLRRKRQISPQGIFAYLLLAFSNLLQGLLLFKSPQRILLRFKQKILKSIENKDLVEVFMKRTRKKGLRIRQRLRVGTYMFVLAILDMYGSYAFSLFVVLTHLGWSTFQLFRMRFAPLPDCVKAHLNEWRFGQILPMILLIAPLYSMITFYAQQIWSDRHSRTKGTGNGSDNIPQPTQPSSSPSSTQAIISDVTLEQDPERNKLHHEVYNTIQFKYVLGSFCFLSVGSVVGFFAQFAYNLAPNSKAQGYHNIGWADTCFSLFPDIIATGCGLTTRLIISIVPLFFSKRF